MTADSTLAQTATDDVSFKPHIVQYSPEYSFCAGCNSCEAVCSLIHENVVGPTYNRLFVQRGGTRNMVCHILTCQQCEDRPCYDACPKQGEAMCIDERGIVYIDGDKCIGCGKCIKACRYDTPRINLVKNANRKKWRAVKCDLCRSRAEGPACVEYCPVRCLGVDRAPQGEVEDPEITEEITLNNLEDRSHD